jgi:hypothetical protein
MGGHLSDSNATGFATTVIVRFAYRSWSPLIIFCRAVLIAGRFGSRFSEGMVLWNKRRNMAYRLSEGGYFQLLWFSYGKILEGWDT